MENRGFMAKTKKKLLYVSLIAFLFAAVLGIFGNQFVTQAHASQPNVNSVDEYIDEYSVADIKNNKWGRGNLF